MARAASVAPVQAVDPAMSLSSIDPATT